MDIAASGPFKIGFRVALPQWRRSNPTELLTKTDLVPILNLEIAMTMKPQTIRNGFRVKSLSFWNPQNCRLLKMSGCE